MHLVGKKDPALKSICEEIPHGDDVSLLVKGMYRILNNNNIGVGLAAPQIGVTKRVILIKYASYDMAIINPVIVKSPGKIVTSINEGCLSFPGIKVDVKRSKRVIVKGFSVDWKPIKLDLRNLAAFIAQHEIDHLNGITIASINDKT